MNEEFVELIVIRVTEALNDVGELLGSLSVEHIGVAVGIVIWVQLVRLTRAVERVSGGAAGDQRMKAAESHIQHLTREVQSLQTYVTSSGRRTPMETR